MTQFATTVLSTGEAFWSDEATSLPPQIESPWHNYVDLTHVKSLALIPLRTTSAGERAEQEICGALVLESLSDAHFTPAQRARMNLVVHYATPSLLHALDHDRIFLMPVWKALGAWRTHLTTTRIAKLSAFAAVSLAIVLLLTCLPWSFDLAARGKVVPRERWEIFAPENGTIISVPVRHGQTVQAGDLLAQLENTELSVQIANLLGRQRITQEQWQANHRALLDSGRGRPKLHPADENRLSGELLQLKQTLAGIEQELQLLREQESRLAIRAQQAGEVVTWQVEQLLLRRPVQQGQALMSVVNPEGDWELELQVPERRLRHLDAAQLAQPQQPLAVSFMLSNLPGREFSGLVREIERTTEASPEGNVIFVRVTFDKHQLPPLRSDTSVTAKLHCGQRSLGYVWFCDLIETVQTHVLFWL
jgi:multidrug efflux pump subunit AcrA (membrane-fusion protein)